MDYSIELDKYDPGMKMKMWKNNDLQNVVVKMATIGTVATNDASTLPA